MADQIGDGLSIFILDDEKDICQFGRQFFERRGFKVFTASAMPAAEAIVRKERLDIAVLDVHIGKASGIDILKLISQKQDGCQCIMLTRDDGQQIMQEAAQMGAVDFLIKPLTLDKIEGAVAKIVKKLRKVDKK